MKNILALFFLLMSFGGCGFHLKQAHELDPDLKFISMEHKGIDPVFVATLESRLKKSGVQIKDSAETSLKILSYQRTRKAASISSSNARQTETRISHSVSYSLSRGSEFLIPPQNLNRNRDYLNNYRDLSGKVDEERLLQKELDQELVELIFRKMENIQTTEISLEKPVDLNAGEKNETDGN